VHAALGPAAPRRYTKFLVGRDGRVYGRYLPRTRPALLEASIVKLLAAGELQEQQPAGAAGAGGQADGRAAAAAAGVLPSERRGRLGAMVDGTLQHLHNLHPRPEDSLLPSQWPEQARRKHPEAVPPSVPLAAPAPPPADPQEAQLPVMAKVAGEPFTNASSC
jgi:glutathione peroxidase